MISRGRDWVVMDTASFSFKSVIFYGEKNENESMSTDDDI